MNYTYLYVHVYIYARNDRGFNWVCFASPITKVKKHNKTHVHRDANSFVRRIEVISFGDSFQVTIKHLCILNETCGAGFGHRQYSIYVIIRRVASARSSPSFLTARGLVPLFLRKIVLAAGCSNNKLTSYRSKRGRAGILFRELFLFRFSLAPVLSGRNGSKLALWILTVGRQCDNTRRCYIR